MTGTAQIKAGHQEPAISIAGLDADYGHEKVLDNISFDVAPGETFGLIGLNGAGKTTMIKIMLGLMRASAGNVRLFGLQNIDRDAKKKIAYLPEKFEPPPFLNAIEFVDFSARLYGARISRAEIRAAAARLDLADSALGRRVNTYSKGMRQKTGLMGTWLTGCPLLILDEPMSGLDPRARVRVKDEIKRCRDAGMTVFLSSHILADMDEICDRVAVLHGGKLQFTGTPAGLKSATGQEFLERAFLQLIDNQPGLAAEGT